MGLLSPYFLALILAWIVAQGTKYILVAFHQRRLGDVRQLYLSGNMPSVHSAVTAALVTIVGLRNGVESDIFAVAALLAGIVMYDAIMVRRSSGEQGVAIQRLIKEQKSAVPLPRAAKGHTPLEVVVGAFVGAAIGLVVFLATK